MRLTNVINAGVLALNLGIVIPTMLASEKPWQVLNLIACVFIAGVWGWTVGNNHGRTHQLNTNQQLHDVYQGVMRTLRTGVLQYMRNLVTNMPAQDGCLNRADVITLFDREIGEGDVVLMPDE